MKTIHDLLKDHVIHITAEDTAYLVTVYHLGTPNDKITERFSFLEMKKYRYSFEDIFRVMIGEKDLDDKIKGYDRKL